MSDSPATSDSTVVDSADAGPAAALHAPASAAATASGAPSALPSRTVLWVAAALAVVAGAALTLAWTTQQRVKALESELVRRQQDSGNAASEARTLARQAEGTSRESAAKLALLEARVAETALQRSQIEELIQSLARSRDENVLADIDAALRVALQQAAITGSADPLVLVLRQSDERLARYNQPRLERVRRAIAQDLDRTRNAGIVDISVLTLRLDDVIRQVDELPLLAVAERRAAGAAPAAPRASASAAPAAPAAVAASAPAGVVSGLANVLGQGWGFVTSRVWQEVRGLVRVTRIDHPEAMLVAPEQAFFLRENLKLRLLNARLALLSRQFDTAQSDLRDAQAALERYFDRTARRTTLAQDTLRQVAVQARTLQLPRPDATLAAIAAAAAGR